MSAIIGIDLGTTNSATAVMQSGGPEILENSEGARTTPSVASVSKQGERLVGTPAKRQAVTNPKNTVYGIKRFIGHKFSDKAVQEDIKTSVFEVKEGKNGGVAVSIDGKDNTPEEISAMIIRKLKEDAESRIGQEIKEAVITVPAYFNDSQRNATKDAGKIAGLDVKRIINEPTAAALAYGFDKKKNEKIVVFDFGGGTFDISILEVGDNVVEVKSTGGNSHLGGRDIDKKLLEYVIAEYKKQSGVDVSKDPLALQRLDEECEKAKKELSEAKETEINIPYITSTPQGPEHLLIKITRAKLEELASNYVKKAIDITKDVLSDSGFSKEEIDEIILVGGQTRMPLVQKEVEEFFNKKPNKSINPDEVVALGAAIQGGILSGDVKDVLLLDVTPLSLGIETMGGVSTKLIEKNTTLPSSASQVFSTAADNQTSVEIHITQGERPMAADNKSLGKFLLDGIDQAPRGVPQVEVTFDIDTNGILNVKAVDKKTNKEQSIKIEASSSLTEEEIEQMKQSAEANAKEDTKKKEKVDAKNIVEQTIYEGEKIKNESKDENAKKEIEAELEKLKKVSDKEVEDMQKAVQDAAQVFSKHKQANEQKEEKDKEQDKKEDKEEDKKDDKGDNVS